MHALLPSLLAGLATALGCLLVLLGRRPDQNTLAVLLGGAAGVMLAVVLLDLLPAAIQTGTPLETGCGFLAGVFILWLFDRTFTRLSSPTGCSKAASYRRTGYLVGVGIALHDLPEGIAIAGAYAAGGILGPLLALSITLHNIPEGIATSAPLQMGGLRRRQVFFLNLLISLCTPLGTLIGLFLIKLSPQHLSFLLALAAGAMTYLIKDELLPSAQRQNPLWCWCGLIAGYLLLWLAQFLA